ncbi:bleomycin resistance protein [Rhizorhabdus wittichii DC-6]|nr:bleomycin resistance protein [Rhizorhabdus wittichii DC-6]
MPIQAVNSVVLGVEDLAAARRFYTDFGLSETTTAADRSDFRTLDGTEINLRRADDPALPPAVVDGPTVREIVWGVDDAATLDRIADELAKDRDAAFDADGVLHSRDDDGYGIAFRVDRRDAYVPPAPRLNLYGAPPARPVNQRIDFAEPIRPASVAHVVLFSTDVIAATCFYTERLGFRVSDMFREGRGAFLRAEGSGYHHNLFLIRGERRGLHHIAFAVNDFNDVVLGGKTMLARDWTPKMGPGRHLIGSNYFWYFESPCGGAMELTADMDRADDDWEVREWDFVPSNTAAWSTSFNPTR